MSMPHETSFYVTLVSNGGVTGEYPNNKASSFRLPQPLLLKGKWQVGFASIYLPGNKNKVPHTVTSHAPTTMTTAPAPVSETENSLFQDCLTITKPFPPSISKK